VIVLALQLGEGRNEVDQRSSLLEPRKWHIRRFALRDSLLKIGFDELQEPALLPAIEPDYGGDVLLLLRTEITDRARNLAEDVARIEH
jgi:hypothetical protein